MSSVFIHLLLSLFDYQAKMVHLVRDESYIKNVIHINMIYYVILVQFDLVCKYVVCLYILLDHILVSNFPKEFHYKK
jgi:hypothetical protein